jgi:zinc/manganese transport system substrate-binding protein
MKVAGIQKSVFISIIVFFYLIFMRNAYALINIVAAENTYGQVAKELGGPYVNVISILTNPSQDPHLFTTTPSTAKAISLADIIIYNGAGYDPWMTSILSIEGQKSRHIINVASLINVKPGDNPHIWYLPTTMPIFAKSLVTSLIKLDPQHQHYYENQLNQFDQSYQIIFATIHRLKQHFQNTPVIATEPVFGYMAKSIGLNMHGESFQINVMNDIPPSASQIKTFEDDLYHHSVHLLIYNHQVINPLTKHMLSIAEEEKIPVLGVTEMIQPKMTYIQWIMKELTELETSLKHS